MQNRFPAMPASFSIQAVLIVMKYYQILKDCFRISEKNKETRQADVSYKSKGNACPELLPEAASLFPEASAYSFLPHSGTKNIRLQTGTPTETVKSNLWIEMLRKEIPNMPTQGFDTSSPAASKISILQSLYIPYLYFLPPEKGTYFRLLLPPA